MRIFGLLAIAIDGGASTRANVVGFVGTRATPQAGRRPALRDPSGGQWPFPVCYLQAWQGHRTVPRIPSEPRPSRPTQFDHRISPLRSRHGAVLAVASGAPSTPVSSPSASRLRRRRTACGDSPQTLQTAIAVPRRSALRYRARQLAHAVTRASGTWDEVTVCPRRCASGSSAMRPCARSASGLPACGGRDDQAAAGARTTAIRSKPA